MSVEDRWNSNEDLKDRYAQTLTENLPALRGKLGISQGDLARCVGISRQTYCAVEGKQRKISWDTYLALCFFFDNHRSTHEMLRNIGAYPRELVERYNDGLKSICNARPILCEKAITHLTGALDEQALHAIRTVMLLEYARCTGLSGDEVLKLFDGERITLAACKAKQNLNK